MQITTGGKTSKYTYDADGIRSTKDVNGTVHEYRTLNGKVVWEKIGEGDTAKIMVFSYDAQGRPFALKFSKNNGASYTNYFYVLNQQGDIVKIFRPVAVKDSANNVTGYEEKVCAIYTYDAWGKLTGIIDSGGNNLINKQTTSTALANLNPLRYRGYYYDNETGFYYLQSRYYDPANRRFINADSYVSTGQGFAGTNMFAYCRNNPVSLADDGGQKWYYTVEEATTTVDSNDGDGNITYKTVIKYSGYAPSYQTFVPDATTEGTTEFLFTIDSRGVAIIDNSQRDDLLLNDDKISLAIADEILAAATEQVDGAMSGRTREGVAREIRFHCKYGFLTKSEKITIADMGGTDKSRTDYDYNAKGFENFFNIPAVLWEMLKKYVF